MIVNKSMYPLQTGFSVISKMQDQFATLQMQLGTGLKAQTLADMGRDLPLSLSVRSRLSTIEGYSANIEQVNLRLSFLDKTLSRFDKMEGEARNAAVPGQYGTGGINMATLPSLSHARLDEVVTLLNEDVAGRYLFGGKTTDKAPVAQTNVLLHGVGGRNGFTELVQVRKEADGVTDPVSPGRLDMSRDDAVVRLTEDGAQAHPFGFKLSTISSTAPETTIKTTAVVPPTTPPADPFVAKTIAVEFLAQPRSGDSINIGLTLPDGTETQVKLTATTDDPAPAGSFKIGADPAETAANFETSLGNGLRHTAQTDLRAASTFAAAENFFDESGKARAPSPAGAAKPTGLVEDTANYIQWYTGSDVPAGQNARQSVSAAIDDGTRVNYGMQANESGFLNLIRSQAALAVSTYPSEDQVRNDLDGLRLAAMAEPEGADRINALAEYEAEVQKTYRLSTGFFDGMATRQQSALSESRNTEAGSIEIITMDIGIAMKSLQNATDRHKTYAGQLTNLLSDVESISKEDVAMEIMSLQTRLTASYQVTSMLSQLSLVNFLR